MYADIDGRTGEAVNIMKPIPLPVLNVSYIYLFKQRILPTMYL